MLLCLGRILCYTNTNGPKISDSYSAAVQIDQGSWQSYEKASVNKWDFKLRLNTEVSDIAWRCGGRQFRAAGPAWRKPRSPNFVLVVRLIYFAVSVDLKRRQLPEEADCTLSTRYCGARPVWIWCISKQSLYLILLATGNQWSCFRAGVTVSCRRRSSTWRAERFELVVTVRLFHSAVQLQ